MRLVVGCGALALLSACEADVKAPVGGEGKVQMAANADGRVAFDLPFAKGEIKLPAGLMSNADFNIDGVKMVPGGAITGFNVDAGNGQPGKVNLTFSAPTDPAQVKAYFLEQFRSHSVEAALVADAIQGTTRDGSTFLMRLAPQGTGTSGTIEIDTGK
jgi:hypothetical protein